MKDFRFPEECKQFLIIIIIINIIIVIIICVYFDLMCYTISCRVIFPRHGAREGQIISTRGNTTPSSTSRLTHWRKNGRAIAAKKAKKNRY